MSEKVSVKVNIGTASTEPTPTEPKSAEPAPKKKFKLNAIQIGAICFVVLFAILCAALAPVTSAAGTLWALFPPVVAIGLALITKEVYSSLLIGTLVGAALAAKFSPAAHTYYTGTANTIGGRDFYGLPVATSLMSFPHYLLREAVTLGAYLALGVL